MCEYKIGDLAWVKLKTYGFWPGRISIPIPELTFPKHFKNFWCIYLFGVNNYQWIDKYYIKPYKEHKEEILKDCPTTALHKAVTELELYIDKPEKFGELDGPRILPDGTDYINYLVDLNKRDVKRKPNNKKQEKNKDNVIKPYVKLEKTDIYRCNGCTAGFLTSEELDRHLSHPVVLLKRIKIYECKVCWQCFTDHKEYKKHALVHVKAIMREERKKELYVDSGRFKKMYPCPECDLQFVQASTLTTHSVVHQPFPYICHCGIGYFKNYDYAQHLKFAHGEDKSVVQVIMKPERKVVYKDSEEDISESSESDHSYVKVTAKPRLKAATRTKPKPKKRSKRHRKDLVPKMENGSYRCQVCSSEFLNVANYNKHYSKEHPSEMPHSCDHCSKKFMTYSARKAHMMHHKDPKWFCEYCNKSFHQKNHLDLHLRVHTKEKPFSCDICKKCFTQSGALNLHKLRHTGIKDFKCQHCDKRFYDAGATKLHERTHTGVKPYECTVKSCGKKFSDPSAFARHVRVHTGDKRYACTYCPKRFTDSSAYYIHKKRHENKKDFVCSFCEKTFLTLSVLRGHLRLHINVGKIFECDICGSKHTRKGNLYTHMKTHLYGGFHCSVCSKVFKTYRELLGHKEKAHKIGKSYKCNVCNNVFWGPEQLNVHRVTVHQYKKTFNCDYCGKKYWKKKLLRQHIIINHLRLPNCFNCQKYFTPKSFESHIRHCKGLRCDICDERFSVTQLQAHLLTHA